MVDVVSGSRATEATATTDDARGPTIKFMGTGMEDYSNFKVAAEFIIDFEETEAKKMKALVRMLGIDALHSLSASRPLAGYTTVAEYWRALDSTYSNGARRTQASGEFEALRQKGTSIQEFIVKFEKLTSILEISGTLRANMFKDKVNMGIRDRLVTSGLTDYGDLKTRAIEVAPMAEADFKRAQKQRDQSKDKKSKDNRDGKTRDDKGRYKPEKGKAAREGRETRKCYLCDMVGHLARDCRRSQGGAYYQQGPIEYEPSRAGTPQHEYIGGGRVYDRPGNWDVYRPQTWRVPPRGYPAASDERLKDSGRFEPAESVQEE